jgi:hypothetical protein
MLTLPNRLNSQGRFRLNPPKVLAAQFRTAPRWLVMLPPQTIPLVVDLEFNPEISWAWSGRWPMPASAVTNAEFEQWLNGSTDQDRPETAMTDAFSGRQPQLQPLELFLVPRSWWIGSNALLSFLLLLGIVRLRKLWLYFALILLTLSTLTLLFVFPQVACWLLVGMAPGLMLGVMLLALEQLANWYFSRRINHLPGFKRSADTADYEPIPNSSAPRSGKAREGSGSRPADRAGA